MRRLCFSEFHLPVGKFSATPSGNVSSSGGTWSIVSSWVFGMSSPSETVAKEDCSGSPFCTHKIFKPILVPNPDTGGNILSYNVDKWAWVVVVSREFSIATGSKFQMIQFFQTSIVFKRAENSPNQLAYKTH